MIRASASRTVRLLGEVVGGAGGHFGGTAARAAVPASRAPRAERAERAERAPGKSRREDHKTLNGKSHVGVFGGAAAAVAVTALLLWLATGPDTWLRGFFFHRSIVQWITLYIFCFGAGALLQRLMVYRREGRALSALVASHRKSGRIGEACPASAVARRLHQVRAHMVKQGPDSVRHYARELADDDADELEAGYSVIHDVIQILPLVGFFGTVLGLSVGLYEHFVTAESGSTTTGFARSIGTAFDTTLLALACTIVVIVLQRLLRKREDSVLCGLDRFVDTYLSSIPATAGPRAAARQNQWPQSAIDEVRRELKTLCRGVAEQARSSLTAACSSATEQSANYARQLTQRLCEQFAERLKQLADSATDQHSRQSESLKQFAGAVEVRLAALADRIDESMRRPRRITITERTYSDEEHGDEAS